MTNSKNKITSRSKLTLSEREHEFVLKRTIEGLSWPEAYKQSHNTTDLTEAVISTRAYRLGQTPRVQKQIDRLREIGACEREITRESHLASLQELKQKALDSGNYGAAVQAEVQRGKAAGLYIEKKEYTVKHDTTALQLLDELNKATIIEGEIIDDANQCASNAMESIKVASKQ